MSNNYDVWFTKWNDWTDGEHTLSVKGFEWKEPLVHFTMRRSGRSEAYKFAVPRIDAVSADGDKALPSFIRESEVDAAVNDYIRHGRNLFETK